MTTNLKVNSETNRTLKMNRKNMTTGFLAGFALMLVATMGMSFTTDDTTRTIDTSVKTSIVKASANENRELVKYTPTNSIIRRADMAMDANFRITESSNRRLAVAYTKLINEQAVEADADMSALINLKALVPTFTNNLNHEIEASDATMDEMMNEDGETRAKTSTYKSVLKSQVNAADMALDVMMNLTIMKNMKPQIAVEADKKMDVMLCGKNMNPSVAFEADSKMDLLISNN